MVDLPEIGVAIVDAIRTVSRFAPADRVQRGRFAAPPMRPFACVSVPGLQSEQGPVMGQYERTAVYDVMAWDSPPDASIHTASLTAETLAHDLHAALEQARMSPASALYKLGIFKLRGATLIGGEAHVPPGEVFALLVLEVRFRRIAGLAGRDA